MINTTLERLTRKDLQEDIEELLFLGYDIYKKLNTFSSSPNEALNQARTIVEKGKLLRIAVQSKSLEELIHDKRALYTQIRELTSITAGILASTEWQSPSYAHSVYSEAGNQTGHITANISDYSRDQTLFGNEYQRRFSQEYIGTWRTLPIQTLLTQSGMAALATILIFLRRKKQFVRPVVIGKHSYFQNKELIYSLISQPIIEVDEHDTPALIRTIKTCKPSAVFFDSVCNSPTIHVPDLKTIVKHLFLAADKETYLVIDNTGASIGFNPLKLLFPFRGKLKILCFESMNKYYQYGMDRTIGGFLWGLPHDASKLFYTRIHAGTIMSDISTAMLPMPNKKRFMLRLKRLERNALFLASSLVKADLPTIKHVYYPRLPHHPAYQWTHDYYFTGSYFTIALPESQSNPHHYQHLINSLIHKARKRSIPLVAGSSFGLNTIRIYITARNAEMGTPFLRISAGNETYMELEALSRLLIDLFS